MTSWASSFKVYLHPKLLVILLLGIASGLPLALTASTLSVWLTEDGLSLKAIGLFASVGTPYALKFLWAPLVDSIRLPILCRFLGRRRGWLLATQILLILAICGMAFSNPKEAVLVTAVWAILVAVGSATQDIIIDAYRVELLDKDQYAAGSAMIILGYRLGMLLSGAGALFLASYVSWTVTYLTMACILPIGMLAALIGGEPASSREADEREAAETAAHAGDPLHIRLLLWSKRTIIEPFTDFMTRPFWAAILLFVVLYKLGDALMGTMTNPFLIDIGFTKQEIATVVKVGGMFATILGTFCGGAVAIKLGLLRGLWITGALHLLTNGFMVLQAHLGHNLPMLWVTITTENFTGGISNAIFVAFLSSLCNARFTATQYALLSSLAVVGRTLLSSTAGFAAEAMSWEWFFSLTILAALPGLFMLIWMQKKGLIKE